MKQIVLAVCTLLVCDGWGEEAVREVKPLEVVTPDCLYGVINDVDPSLGVWNVNRYEDRVVREKGEGLNEYKFACMTCLKQKLGNRARQEASKTYFSPAFFTLDPTSSENAKFAESLDSNAVTPIGGDDSVHPGLDGHKGIGFQVYAWILSTLADGDKR